MIFDAALFVAKAVAGSLAKGVGTDAYKKLKSILTEKFNLSGALSVVEEKPDGESEVEFLASKISETELVVEPEVIQLAKVLAEEVSRLEGASGPTSTFDISEIEAAEVLVERVKVKGNSAFKVEDINTPGRVNIRDIELDGS